MKTKLFIIATIVLLYGQNLLYSQNGWKYLSGLNDKYLWKVYAQTPDTVYIAGLSSYSNGQGLIAKSTDGGANWTKTVIATNNLLKDITFYNKSIGFTIGDKGVILKTTNSGTDWQLKTSGTTQNLNAIALAGLSNIWAVGDSGVVIHSVDEGETWQKVDLQLTSNLNDIAFKKDTGYIAGNSGLVYKTINTGAIWTKELIPNTILDPFYDCKSLCLTEHNIYILSGWDSGLGYNQVSKKNSTTWQSDFNQSTSFAFANDSVGYSVYQGITTGSSGYIFRILNTINSGKSWSFVYDNAVNGMDTQHSDICIVNDTVKYIVTGGAILKSTPSTLITALNEELTDKNIGITIFQSLSQDALIVKSNLQPVSLVELFNVSGNKVLCKKMDTKLTETIVDISHFPVGVYLAKVTLNDKTQTVYKWIKQ